MYHYFNAITNTKGDALIGYYVKVVNTSTGDLVSLYADENSTPIISVSGVANAAKVDSDGMADFYLSAGTYHLDIYATDATTFVRRFRNVPMVQDLDSSTPESIASRTALASSNTAIPVTLMEAGREGVFFFDDSDLSYQVGMDTRQAVYVAPSSDTTGASGAWVRQYNGPLKIEWFGGVADWNGTTGTDNLAALNAALDFEKLPSLNFSPTVELGLGKYYVSSTLEIEAVCHLIGQGSGSDSASVTGTFATMLVWPVDTLCIRIHNSDTHLATTQTGDATKSAAGTHIEGICISQATQGTSTSAHGVWMRSHATLSRCSFYRIAANAIHNVAYSAGAGATRGNTSEWKVVDCFVYSCGGDGIHTFGSDANAGYCIGFKTKFCGGCGIYDVGTLGNSYIAPQISGYGTYGGTLGGVYQGGHNYQLIVSIESGETLGNTTTPGTNTLVWYDLGTAGSATTAFPQWVSGTSYSFRSPIHITGDSNCSVVVQPYIEAGATLGHVDGPACVVGGPGNFTNRTACFGPLHNRGSALVNATGIGAYKASSAGSSERTNFGTYQYTYLGSGNPDDGTYPPNILSHQREKDADQPLYWGYSGASDPNPYLYYGNQRRMLWLANKGTSQQAGTGASKPYYLTLPDIIKYSEDGSAEARVEGLRNAVPSSGTHARGEFYRNYDPTTNGTFGWLCTTTGTPGTWQTVTAPTGSNTGDETAGTVVAKIAGQALAPASVAATGALSAGTTVTATGKAIGTAGIQSGNDTFYRSDGSVLMSDPTGLNILQFFSPGGGVYRFRNSADSVSLLEIANDGSIQASGAAFLTSAQKIACPVASTGAVTSSSATAGIGYATGAGGTVTQITSRTTGATLNKVCGAITLVSAAGTASWQTFTVTNSAVAATDIPRVVQKSGTDKYMIHVTAVAAGSFDISFATTGGTTTEQPVFNFSVEKAVAA